MDGIRIKIENLKNIKSADMELPFDRGLYAFVGGNGCGKSSLMLALSLIVKTSSSRLIEDSSGQDVLVEITSNSITDIWKKDDRGFFTPHEIPRRRIRPSVHFHGFYEGSIFYGSRFADYQIMPKFLSSNDVLTLLKGADEYVSESLGYILHNDKNYYTRLLKFKSRKLAEKYEFRGVPYFIQTNNGLISQYQMSSGESMLISLFDFLNNLVILGNYDKLFFLIDEAELALHPSAIDRLLIFLKDLEKTSKTDLVIYFSTHSTELIHRIKPDNIFLLENNNGVLTTVNPCYPNYAIRNLYVPNGFDFLILVEDELAKCFVEKVLRDNNLGVSKLCCVIPAGGYLQMLKLHHDMLVYNTLGVGKRILSVYDGDIKDNVKKLDQYKDFTKTFLPFPSIEKFLLNNLIVNPNKQILKVLGDKYFTTRSLSDIISDYKNDERTKNSTKNDGKAFFKILCAELRKNNISKEKFIDYLCADLVNFVNITDFENSFRKLIT